MKFTLTTKTSSGEMNEDYDTDTVNVIADDGIMLTDTGIEANQKSIEQWGRAVVTFFNSTLRENETPRKFISVNFKQEGN